MKKIFINYSWEHDTDSAVKIYDLLAALNEFAVWMDKKNLPAGMKWKPAILNVIRESDFFISLLSDNSIQGQGERNREIYEALDWTLRFPPNKIFLIPVLIDECEPPFEEMNKVNWVRLFPNWKDGWNELVKTLRIEKPASAVSENTTFAKKRYHSRVGLVDIDMGLTNLPEIATQLNNIQRYFLFSCPPMPALKNCTKKFEGVKNLAVYKIPQAYISEHPHLQIDLLACITKYPLAFDNGDEIIYNYFAGESSEDDRFLFLSADNLYNYCKQADCSFEEGVVCLLTGQLVAYFTEVDYHKETRGCAMDLCEDRDDIVHNLKSRQFCTECLNKLPDEIKDPLQQLLAWKYV